jgi:nucleoid-associated protein YgaU
MCAANPTAPLPFASWTQKGQRPQAATLDSGYFLRVERDGQQRIVVGQQCVRACVRARPFLS